MIPYRPLGMGALLEGRHWVEALPEEHQAEVLRSRLHLPQVLVHLRARLVQGLQRRPAELELPPRLERDALAPLLEPDDVARLHNRLPPVVRLQALQQRAHLRVRDAPAVSRPPPAGPFRKPNFSC